MAMQAWNFKGMVFFPDNAFLEFIPVEEVRKNQEDPAYEPKTLLYNELDLGIYELVLSNFNGGILVRYRIGDLFEVIANRDEETKSELPQMKFFSRADDIIDLGSFFRLTEREIWKTIEASGLEYRDWVAQKNTNGSYPTLSLFVEPVKSGALTQEQVQDLIRKSFAERFSDYNDMKEMLGIEPVTVGLIPNGAFAAYMKAMMAAGADLAHMKPPHMKPSDAILAKLLAVPAGSNT
jgi:hypothetical protein